MKAGLKRALLTVLTILFVILSAGCKKEQQESEGYNIYFVNTAGDKLVSFQYQTETSDPVTLIYELLEQMDQRQNQRDAEVLKPDNVNIENLEISNSMANIYFSKEYNDMESVRELLYRAGVVKMLTQINEIKYVQFYVENSPAQYADGTMIGIMESSDFVDDSNERVGSVEWKEINLYYANKLGDKLVRKKETIAYSKNVSLEKMVVERLIKGPSDTDMTATLPADLKLLSISVSDGVCYVNLDSAFLTEMVNVSNELPVYSIVNSLCELGSVRSVRIMINGDTTKTFRESISLDSNFKYNRDLVAY